MRTQSKSSAQRRQTNPMSGFDLLNRCSKAQLDEDHIRALLLAYHGALTGLTTGYGNEQQWNTVAFSLNIALMLAELGVQPQALQIIQDAQLALIRVRDAAIQSGEWQLGVHTFIINCAFKQHDEQIVLATISQHRAALKEVRRRVNEGNYL